MLVFINVLAVIVGFILLTESSISAKSILLAIFMGIIALYNYAGGLLYWPIGLALLCFQPRLANDKKKKFISFWILSTIIILLTYFYNYKRPAYSPPIPLIYALKFPTETINLTLQILGSPLEMTNPNFSMILALSGLIIFIFLISQLRMVQKNSTLMLFLAAISLYGITNSTLTSAGRIQFGLHQQLISRYSTIPVLFWISLLILLFLYLNSAKKTTVSGDLKILAIFLLVVITYLSAHSFYQGTIIAKDRSSLLQNALKNFLYSKPSIDRLIILSPIYPRTIIDGHENVNISSLNKDLNTLSKHKLTFFKYLK